MMADLNSSDEGSKTTELVVDITKLVGEQDKEHAVMQTEPVFGAKMFRVYWGHHRGRNTCTVTGPEFNNQTVVLVTASEGDEGNSTASPRRFIGAADYTVKNIAPFEGGVRFVVDIGWPVPIPLWTDIVIMPGYPTFIRA